IAVGKARKIRDVLEAGEAVCGYRDARQPAQPKARRSGIDAAGGDVGFDPDAVAELDLARGEYAAREYAFDFELHTDSDVTGDAAFEAGRARSHHKLVSDLETAGRYSGRYGCDKPLDLEIGRILHLRAVGFDIAGVKRAAYRDGTCARVALGFDKEAVPRVTRRIWHVFDDRSVVGHRQRADLKRHRDTVVILNEALHFE